MTSISKSCALRRDLNAAGCRRGRRCNANAAPVSTTRKQVPITELTPSVKGLRLHELSMLLSEAGIAKPQLSAEGVPYQYKVKPKPFQKQNTVHRWR